MLNVGLSPSLQIVLTFHASFAAVAFLESQTKPRPNLLSESVERPATGVNKIFHVLFCSRAHCSVLRGAFHWDLEQLPQLPAIEKQLEANSIGIVASGVAGGVGKLYLVAEKVSTLLAPMLHFFLTPLSVARG